MSRTSSLLINEHPLQVYDRGEYRTWHPDFALPTYDGLIVEYAGMPDRPDYMQGIRHKQGVYRANEIPALFVYPEDLKGPRWPERVLERISRACYRIARRPAMHAKTGRGCFY